MTFGYDGEGQRVSKTSGSVTTHYTYEGSKLIRQEKNGERLFFLYDATGLVGFDHITGSGTTTYYYRYDGKGEITALTDAAGNVVANYHYDAWGRDLGVTDASGTAITSSTHIGVINPFRYKSYYYGAETKLYYLNSRYYDPEVCRFISADDADFLGYDNSLVSYNLFSYCLNNPIRYIDQSGAYAEAVRHWALYMWWLPGVDSFWPFFDIAYGIGFVVLSGFVFLRATIWFSQVEAKENETPSALPPEGEANTDKELYDKDGTLKQKRHYGPDGKAEYDIDYKHGGKHPFPHKHTWDWGKEPPRSNIHIPMNK